MEKDVDHLSPSAILLSSAIGGATAVVIGTKAVHIYRAVQQPADNTYSNSCIYYYNALDIYVYIYAYIHTSCIMYVCTRFPAYTCQPAVQQALVVYSLTFPTWVSGSALRSRANIETQGSVHSVLRTTPHSDQPDSMAYWAWRFLPVREVVGSVHVTRRGSRIS